MRTSEQIDAMELMGLNPIGSSKRILQRVEELEKEAITKALDMNDWNQSKAARFLRIPRHVLIYRMEKFGVGNK